MKKPRAAVVVRWLLAGALAVWTARQAHIAGTTTVEMVGALRGIYTLAGVLTTALLVGPEVVGWAVTPLHRMIDAVLLPGGSEPPPADYTLARFYLQQMRYEESCEEYFKIIHYHPRERLAYLEGISAAGQAGQLELAEKFHRLGRRVFRQASVRRQLQSVLDSSRLAIETAPNDDVPLELVEDSPPPEPPAGPVQP